MASVTLGGNPVNTVGELPSVGTQAPDFTVTNAELANVASGDFRGKRVVLRPERGGETKKRPTVVRVPLQILPIHLLRLGTLARLQKRRAQQLARLDGDGGELRGGVRRDSFGPDDP